MSYSLFGEQEGHIGQVASVGGMNDLLDFVARVRVWGPLSTFLERGITSDVPGVISEIKQFLPFCTDPNVKSTLQGLQQGLEKIKGTAIISD
jgi:hypothetical protein